MEKKVVHIKGATEAVEDVVRVFDKVFRSKYNVYGAHRDNSYKLMGVYHVIMSYEAEWDKDPLFPEYSWAGVKRAFYRQALRLPDTEEYWFEYEEGRA